MLNQSNSKEVYFRLKYKSLKWENLRCVGVHGVRGFALWILCIQIKISDMFFITAPGWLCVQE